MDPQEIMPSDILQSQICTECFRYLSVFPTVVNDKGEKICGRCIKSKGGNCTKSFFNTIANGYLFPCTNYLEGCDKVLNYAEVEEHEMSCVYEPQNCFFCSFSGNLVQILNHSVQAHSENISLGGIIQFSLSASVKEKTLLLAIQSNQIILATLNIDKGLFKIVFKLVSKNASKTINHYAVKFFKSKDPADTNFSINQYGLLNTTLENSCERTLEDLVAVFGEGITLNCQISISNFTLKKDQLKLQNRMHELQNFEQEMVTLKKELQSKDTYLSEQTNSYKSMIEVFKVICPKMFKCVNCKQLSKEVYYCQELHFYCMTCLSVFCNLCNSIMKFERLSDLDQILLPCVWMACEKKCSIENFFSHKRQCSWRPFKCPLTNCTEVVLSKEKFVKHWHSEIIPLILEDTFNMSDTCKAKEFYWFLSNRDLYRVVIRFQTVIQVLIEQVNVLGEASFVCEGFANNSWHILDVYKFCDSWQVTKEINYTTRFSLNNTTQGMSYTQLMLYCSSLVKRESEITEVQNPACVANSNFGQALPGSTVTVASPSISFDWPFVPKTLSKITEKSLTEQVPNSTGPANSNFGQALPSSTVTVTSPSCFSFGASNVKSDPDDASKGGSNAGSNIEVLPTKSPISTVTLPQSRLLDETWTTVRRQSPQLARRTNK